MKKLLLAFTFLVLSAPSFAGLIFTNTGEVNPQDVYDNVSLWTFGNKNLTADNYWYGTYNGYIKLPTNANVIIFDSPAVDFTFNAFTRFDDHNLNILDSFFTLSSSYINNSEIAFYSADMFQNMYFSIRALYSPNSTAPDYFSTGVWLENIRFGTYTHSAHAPPPTTSVDGPTTISIFVLALAGLFYSRRKMQKAQIEKS